MTKEIRQVDIDKGIMRCTTLDERFYGKWTKNEAGFDSLVWRPSVTFIVDYYPKGPGFMKWVKSNGDDADNIARLAADRGYKVHEALALLNAGMSVCGCSYPGRPADKFHSPLSGKEEELTTEEYAAVLSYADWWKTEGREKYKILGSEFVTWPDPEKLAEETTWPKAAFEFAGTIDLKVEQIDNGSIGIIDFKTSKDIWPSHRMQAAAYAVSEGAEWAATLQLNYQRTKTKRWKFTPLDVKHWFRLFMSTKNIWNEENDGIQPLQRDYPLEVSLNPEPKE